MSLLNLISKKKSITTFFILAYTFAILTFSIGTSAITSEKNKVENFNKNNNTVVSFLDNNLDITSKVLLDIVKNDEVTVKLSTYQNINGNITELITDIKSNGIPYTPDMKSGVYFTQTDFESSDEIAIFSSTVNLSNEIYRLNKDIKLKSKGILYERKSQIIVPNKVFFAFMDTDYLSIPNIVVFINGNESSVNSAITNIENYINVNGNISSIKIAPYVIEDVSYEAENLYKSSFLIVLITIINSISISALWVEEMKKEIVLRKVVGAKNYDIFKLYFTELTIISLLAFIASMLIQLTLTLLTNGYIYGINISLHLNNILYAFIVAITIAYASALPSFIYLTKIEPTKLLREE